MIPSSKIAFREKPINLWLNANQIIYKENWYWIIYGSRERENEIFNVITEIFMLGFNDSHWWGHKIDKHLQIET